MGRQTVSVVFGVLTYRDIEGLVEELRDMHDEVRADLARSIDDEPEPETPN